MILFIGQVDARHARARGVPGGRLQARSSARMAKWVVEIDDAGAHPRARRARLPRRHAGPARPGRDRAAGGHADRDSRRRRCAARRAGRDAGRRRRRWRELQTRCWRGRAPVRHRSAARAGRETAAPAHRALRRALRPAGRHLVPPRRCCFRRRPSELCRRCRHRHQPEAGGAHQGRRPRCSWSAAACRRCRPRPIRCSTSRRRSRRSCMSIRAPRSSAASISRRSPSTRRPTAFAAALEALQPPARDRLEARGRRGACRLPRLDRQRRAKLPGAFQYGEVMAWLRDRLPDDAIVCNGAGNYADWVHRYLPLPPLRHAARADLRLDGLRRCRRRSRAKRQYPGSHRRRASPATAAS